MHRMNGRKKHCGHASTYTHTHTHTHTHQGCMQDLELGRGQIEIPKIWGGGGEVGYVTMLKASFRVLGGVSLWYCRGVHY